MIYCQPKLIQCTSHRANPLCLLDFAERVLVFCRRLDLSRSRLPIRLLLLLLLLLLLIALFDPMTQQWLVVDVQASQRLRQRRVVLLALAGTKLHTLRLEGLGLHRSCSFFQTRVARRRCVVGRRRRLIAVLLREAGRGIAGVRILTSACHFATLDFELLGTTLEFLLGLVFLVLRARVTT